MRNVRNEENFYMAEVFSNMKVKFFNFLTVEQMQLLGDAIRLEKSRLSIKAVAGARNTQCCLSLPSTLKKRITSNKLERIILGPFNSLAFR